MIAGQLIVQPNVFDPERQLLQQMEDHLQLRIDERFPRHAAIKYRHADDRLTIQNRHCDLAAEPLEFFLGLRIISNLFGVTL